VKPYRRALHQHLKDRLHHATKPKCIVTVGVTFAAMLQAAGLHEAALGMSIITNLVWIWE
jgi:hypothetical protein